MFGDYRDPWAETDQLSVSGLRSVAEQAASAMSQTLTGGTSLVSAVGSIASPVGPRWTAYGHVSRFFFPSRGNFLGTGQVEIYRARIDAASTTSEMVPTGEFVEAYNPVDQPIGVGMPVFLHLDEDSGFYFVAQFPTVPLICNSSLALGRLICASFENFQDITLTSVASAGSSWSGYDRRFEAWVPGDYTLDGEEIRVKIVLTFEASTNPLLIFYAYDMEGNYVRQLQGERGLAITNCGPFLAEVPTSYIVTDEVVDLGQCTIVPYSCGNVEIADCSGELYPSSVEVILSSPTCRALNGTYTLSTIGSAGWLGVFLVGGRTIRIGLGGHGTGSLALTVYQHLAGEATAYQPCGPLPIQFELTGFAWLGCSSGDVIYAYVRSVTS